MQNYKVSKSVNVSRGRGGGYRPCEICDFTRLNCLIYIKSENIIGNLGKLSTRSWKIGTFT